MERFQPLFKSLSTSVYGMLIKIEYVLKVMIKHEGVFEFGKEAVASMPIQILQPPVQMIAAQ